MTTGVPSFIRDNADRLCHYFPELRKHLRRLHDKYLYVYFWYMKRRHCIEGPHAKIDDFQLLHVDPKSIQLANDPGFFFTIGSECEVLSGDWDQGLPRFEDTFPYQAFEKRFVHGADWSETEMYDFLQKMFAAGRSWGGYTSFPEANERLQAIDELFDNIKRNGYVTQEEITQNEDMHPIGVPQWADDDPGRHEIAVDIGRNGQIIFEDGRHRLTIAKILDIEKIPVQVVVRHQDWQAKREQYANTGKEANHPDLQFG